MTVEAYEAPKVKVIEVEVEKGFAASIEELDIVNEELSW